MAADVQETTFVPSALQFLVAFLLSVIWLIGLESLWEWSLRKACKLRSVRWSTTAHVFMKSYLARYAPGKVWPFAVRVSSLTKAGVRWPLVLTASAVEQLCFALGTLVSAAWLFAFLLTSTSFKMDAPLALALLAPLAVLVPAFLARRQIGLYLEKWLNDYMLSKVGGELDRLRLPNQKAWAVGILLGAMLACAQALTVLPLLVPMLNQHYSLFAIVSIAMAYPTARLAGQIAAVFPAGLGVREGLFVLLLLPVVQADSAAVLALWLRVISGSAELVLFATTSVLDSRLLLSPRKHCG